MSLEPLVNLARSGDLDAYSRLIASTQAMVYAVARRILRRRDDALDAVQETYLRAFRRLPSLNDAAAFPGYLRRIAVTTACDMRRARRSSFVLTGEVPEIPILDDAERSWTESQRRALSRALLSLSPAERRICDRYYHGGWSLPRLAADALAAEPAMRKRLQRIRDKLREEIEMYEQRLTEGEPLPSNLPDKVIELLAKPKLVDLPENPVGRIADMLRAHFSDYQLVDLPEVLDLKDARARFERDPVYVPAESIIHVSGDHYLRYDLSLPILLNAQGRGGPLRLLSSGKVYRNEVLSATHLQAFHQLELLCLEPSRIDPWSFVGRVLGALEAVIPEAPQRIYPAKYPFCTQAWEIGVEVDGRYTEVLGCGVYVPDIVKHLGADPAQGSAIGVGFGLERLASLRFSIPDVRKIESTRLQ
jgi:RNA polymerase sigma-70 factor (ECF subfamily)